MISTAGGERPQESHPLPLPDIFPSLSLLLEVLIDRSIAYLRVKYTLGM
ncbi:MAG: hypothetical protein HYX84_03550 [Chloroflexi bacterium]|nr:hypothetical protein [Chloroflexota bacterium]